MIPAAAAVRRDAFHSVQRAAAYKPGLMRPWPGRKPPSDASTDLRDPLRPTWRRMAEAAIRENLT